MFSSILKSIGAKAIRRLDSRYRKSGRAYEVIFAAQLDPPIPVSASESTAQKMHKKDTDTAKRNERESEHTATDIATHMQSLSHWTKQYANTPA